MDAGEEYTKLVDGVYKNILDKFNPGARQLITTGKAYLKALHGAASASRLFNEALAKIAMNAQQNGTNDIGSALMNVVSVYKEIQDHQMNILKAFYVDLLVPLETNLEKDTKVVQHEQKKFLQQHKMRIESYHKAASTIKKQRKKKSNIEISDKEMKNIQALNEQKTKLESFCEQSLKNAMTQERRRYGFVLERHCSISKHWMAYHAHGNKIMESNLDNWMDVAASREIIPPSFDNNFAKKMEKLREDDDSRAGTMKKARSVDAPYGDMRSLNERNYSQNSLPRAKSDFNLTASSNENWDQRPVVKALYAYMPSGENQLPFAEGDRIALAGTKVKGWQFGENLRTQMFGWFPVAYTNADSIINDKRHRRESSYENVQFERNGGGSGDTNGGHHTNPRYSHNSNNDYLSDNMMDHQSMGSDSTYRRRNTSHEESSPSRMFGDTLQYRNQKRYRNNSGKNSNPKPGPPPQLPAPVPSSLHSGRLNVSQSFCSPNGPPIVERRKNKGHNPQAMLQQQQKQQHQQKGPRDGAAKTSLHSSNDSGFANEPPPQPEIDYSDEEQSRIPIRRRTEANYQSSRPDSTASWTLNRSYRNSSSSNIVQSKTLMRQSASFENVIESDEETLRGQIKRTKSFWKFGKSSSDDILTGMSLWQHRDLVQPSSKDDATMTTETATLDKRKSIKEKVRRMSNSTIGNGENDDNIYGVAQPPPNKTPKGKKKMLQTIAIDIEDPSDVETINSGINRMEYRERREPQQREQKLNNVQPQTIVAQQEIDITSNSEDDDDDTGTLKMSDVNNFFDESSAQNGKKVPKYLKRQEILKQYYNSSEDEDSDEEVKSTSSDPYDCIVIHDHLVQNDEKHKMRKQQMDFQTFRQPPPPSETNTLKSKAKSQTNNKSQKLNNIKNDKRDERYRAKDESMAPSSGTATILPRTKLMKSTNNNLTLEKNMKKKNKDVSQNTNGSAADKEKEKNFAKTYGPWYDFWDHQDMVSNNNNSNMKPLK